MAITSDKQVIHRGLEAVSELPAVKATLAGELLVVNSNNEVSAAYRTTALVFAGIAMEGVTSGSKCKFLRNGSVVAITSTGSITYGDVVYIHDNEKVAPSGTLTGAPTNSPAVRVGIALEPHESLSNTRWVLIDPTS